MVLGQSGTGKTTSLRNMNPADTLLIQVIAKPLPFRNAEWKPVAEKGNVLIANSSESIIKAMRKTTRSVIVVDDLQYLLATEFMARAYEKGYEKFTEMALHYYNVLMAASALDDYKRVYLLSHTDTSDSGRIKAKTIGKMLDEKITVEGLLTIVFRTSVINGQYVFNTRNNGADTVKTPMGMFADEHIDNDLSAVDAAIVEYYGLKKSA